REFPDLRLELRLAERPGAPAPPTDMAVFVVPDSSGSADPSVPAGSSRDSSRGYDVHPLLEEPYVAVLPDGHRLAGRSRVGLRELADEPWVDNDVTRGPCRQVVMDACASVGFTPAFRIETPDYPTAISFVATGVGV